MKKNLLKTIAVVAALMAGGMSVNAQEISGSQTSVKNPTADIWVRSDNTTYRGIGDTMEMKNYNDGSKLSFFCGLMSFELDEKEGMEIESATLRLTTRYAKGDREVAVYAYDGNIDETSVNYEKSVEAINAAMQKSAVATFNAKSCSVWAPTDKDITDEYKVVDAWINTIDLTDYLKSLSTTSVKLLLTKVKEENSSTQIYTKEVNDVTLHKDAGGGTFKASDLVPQLTIIYTVKNGINDINVGTQKQADGAVYNLAGQRVNNPQHGIYVKNGRKYIVK